jgi:hypothetical protein
MASDYSVFFPRLLFSSLHSPEHVAEAVKLARLCFNARHIKSAKRAVDEAVTLVGAMQLVLAERTEAEQDLVAELQRMKACIPHA